MGEAEGRAARLRPATKDDLLGLEGRKLGMSHEWKLYLTDWAMDLLYREFGGTLTYMLIIPDEKEAAIYMQGAARTDPGAQQLSFSPTRRTAQVNLHYAIARFGKRPVKGRRLSLPAQMVDDPDLGRVLRLDVGRAEVVLAARKDRGEEHISDRS